MSSFSERLRDLRKEKQLSQEELGDKINVPRATISSWEAKYNIPGIEMLHTLADFFNVTIDYILGYSEVRNPLQLVISIQEIYNSIQNDEELAESLKNLLAYREFRDLIKQCRDLSPRTFSVLTKVTNAIKDDIIQN